MQINQLHIVARDMEASVRRVENFARADESDSRLLSIKLFGVSRSICSPWHTSA